MIHLRSYVSLASRDTLVSKGYRYFLSYNVAAFGEIQCSYSLSIISNYIAHVWADFEWTKKPLDRFASFFLYPCKGIARPADVKVQHLFDVVRKSNVTLIKTFSFLKHNFLLL